LSPPPPRPSSQQAVPESARAATAGFVAAGVLGYSLEAVAAWGTPDKLGVRYFVDFSPGDPDLALHHVHLESTAVFNDEFMGRFLEKLIAAPGVKTLFSNEHFLVDCTLL
jgi:hypothetical protein